jgi:hypothetical protein
MKRKDDSMMLFVNDDLREDLDDDSEVLILEILDDLMVDPSILILEIYLVEYFEVDLDEGEVKYVSERISKKL